MDKGTIDATVNSVFYWYLRKTPIDTDYSYWENKYAAETDPVAMRKDLIYQVKTFQNATYKKAMMTWAVYGAVALVVIGFIIRKVLRRKR